MHRPPYVDAMKLFSHPVNDCEEHWHIHTHHPLELQNNLKYTRSLLLSLMWMPWNSFYILWMTVKNTGAFILIILQNNLKYTRSLLLSLISFFFLLICHQVFLLKHCKHRSHAQPWSLNIIIIDHNTFVQSLVWF